MNIPKISIIIATKNAQRTIRKCLDSIFSLDYSKYEVIVVSDGSKDNTNNILKAYINRIKFITTEGIGPSAVRNLAARQADAEYIAFTDSDCIVDKNWLTELLKGFKEYPVAVACGGVQKLPFDSTSFEKRVFLFMKKTGFITEYMRKTKGANLIEVNHNASCNVMYKRDIFLKEEGFLEGLWPGEDVELDFRLKKKDYKVVFNPKAIIYHYQSKDLKSFLRMMYRYGWAQGFLVRKYSIFRKVQTIPISIIILLFLFLSLLFLNKTLAFCFIFAVTFLAVVYLSDFYSLGLFLSGGIFWYFGFIIGLIRK